MVTTKNDIQQKHYIDFCDHIFALEDILVVDRYYTWNTSKTNKEERIWVSKVYLNGDLAFCIKEDKYEELKEKIVNLYEDNKKTHI